MLLYLTHTLEVGVVLVFTHAQGVDGTSGRRGEWVRNTSDVFLVCGIVPDDTQLVWQLGQGRELISVKQQAGCFPRVILGSSAAFRFLRSLGLRGEERVVRTLDSRYPLCSSVICLRVSGSQKPKAQRSLALGFHHTHALSVSHSGSLSLSSFPSKMLPTATSPSPALSNPTAAVKTEVDLDVKKSFEASGVHSSISRISYTLVHKTAALYCCRLRLYLQHQQLQWIGSSTSKHLLRKSSSSRLQLSSCGAAC